ncbi:YcjF family protein [Clostridium sp.]
MDFKADDFNFEEEYSKIKSKVKKPNILLCGATGVGKSSVINKIFGRDVAKVGSGQPVTRGITKYQDESLDVILYDSEGYEVGNAALSHFRKDIIGFIDKKQNESQDLGSQIHLVWYCISAGNKRITELDLEVIKEIQLRKIKVAVLFTQIDAVDEEELNALIKTLRKEIHYMDYFNLSINDEVPKEYLDWEKLMAWSVENLDESLREGFINSTVMGLEEKKKYIRKVIIPRYAVSAAGIALSPVPLSDSVLLMPLQTTMALHIFDIWGITKNKQALKALLSTTIISQLGKSVAKLLAGNILKLVPLAGDMAGGAINAAVATSITYTLGYAISEICNKYAESILKDGNADILDFFTKSNIEEMLRHFSKATNRGV